MTNIIDNRLRNTQFLSECYFYTVLIIYLFIALLTIDHRLIIIIVLLLLVSQKYDIFSIRFNGKMIV